MISKLCNHAGCKKLVPFNVAYCDKHKQDGKRGGEYDQYQHRKEIGGKYFAFYKSRAWRKLSQSYRLRFPVCEDCLKRDLYVKADVVDHIVPIRADWTKRLDESNLQSLCNGCHWRKTQADVTRYDLPPLEKRGAGL